MRQHLIPLCIGCPALQIPEDLVEEDDRVPNVWLLLALALQQAGELDEALIAGGWVCF